MKPRACRGFGVLDAMIVIAAIAAFLGVSHGISLWPKDPHDFQFWQQLGRRWGLLLLVLSAASVVIRLRRPRPRYRRLWMQPGFTACALALFGFAVSASSTALRFHASLFSSEYYTRAAFFEGWPYAGPAVLGAWLTLILTRRWRSERSTIDRLGRLVGLCWLVELFFSELPGSRWLLVIFNLAHLR